MELGQSQYYSQILYLQSWIRICASNLQRVYHHSFINFVFFSGNIFVWILLRLFYRAVFTKNPQMQGSGDSLNTTHK